MFSQQQGHFVYLPKRSSVSFMFRAKQDDTSRGEGGYTSDKFECIIISQKCFLPVEFRILAPQRARVKQNNETSRRCTLQHWWRMRICPVKVGCGGFVAESVVSLLRELREWKTVKETSDESSQLERVSRFGWGEIVLVWSTKNGRELCGCVLWAVSQRGREVGGALCPAILRCCGNRLDQTPLKGGSPLGNNSDIRVLLK